MSTTSTQRSPSQVGRLPVLSSPDSKQRAAQAKTTPATTAVATRAMGQLPPVIRFRDKPVSSEAVAAAAALTALDFRNPRGRDAKGPTKFHFELVFPPRTPDSPSTFSTDRPEPSYVGPEPSYSTSGTTSSSSGAETSRTDLPTSRELDYKTPQPAPKSFIAGLLAAARESLKHRPYGS